MHFSLDVAFDSVAFALALLYQRAIWCLSHATQSAICLKHGLYGHLRLMLCIQEGSLLDEVNRRAEAHDPFRHKEILHIFLQVTRLVAHCLLCDDHPPVWTFQLLFVSC